MSSSKVHQRSAFKARTHSKPLPSLPAEAVSMARVGVNNSSMRRGHRDQSSSRSNTRVEAWCLAVDFELNNVDTDEDEDLVEEQKEQAVEKPIVEASEVSF